MTQRTLVLLKPDAVRRGQVGEIIRRIEAKGYALVALELRTATPEVLAEHYAEHEGKPFYQPLVDFMLSGPVVAIVLEGERCIEGFRSLAGATDPTAAAPGTIRGDLGRDWGRRSSRTSCTAPTRPESAEREIGIWFPQPLTRPDGFGRVLRAASPHGAASVSRPPAGQRASTWPPAPPRWRGPRRSVTGRSRHPLRLRPRHRERDRRGPVSARLDRSALVRLAAALVDSGWEVGTCPARYAGSARSAAPCGCRVVRRSGGTFVLTVTSAPLPVGVGRARSWRL